MKNQEKQPNEKPFVVRRGRVDSVDLFEVKENELEVLANGESTGIYLNFSIFLFSIALTCITGLFTADFKTSLIENAFLFTSIIGIIGGTFLIILWWRDRKSIKTIINRIKNRIPCDTPQKSKDSVSHVDSENNNEVDLSAPKG